MNNLFGMRVVSHPLAREVRDEWKVEPWPIKKHRRGWRVVKHHIDRPGCYQVGDTLYMHPELVTKLRENVPNEKHQGPGVSPVPLDALVGRK